MTRKSPGKNKDYGKFRALYRTNRWKKISLAQRAREPLCRNCRSRGLIVVGTTCDHVYGHPADETEEQFWAGPFQTLCSECHSGDKRMEERSGRLKGCGLDGWPESRA